MTTANRDPPEGIRRERPRWRLDRDRVDGRSLRERACGAGLPPPDSAWGLKLTIKLLAVALFIPISLVRTIVVARLYNPQHATLSMPVVTAFKSAWGFTSVFLGAIVLLAEALAHG